jgi:hypothetical protein
MGVGRSFGTVSLGLAVALSSSALRGQDSPIAAISEQETSTAATVLQSLTPEQRPPNQPHVTCSGDLLTISASNSTLAGVLAAVRACTGAEIEVPESAAEERLFATLGPGPVRQVLGALLSSTDFNYLIQSSDSDPQKIRTVLLMARPANDATTVAAAAVPSGKRRWPQARRNAIESAGDSSEEASQTSNSVEQATVLSVEPAAAVAIQTPAIGAPELASGSGLIDSSEAASVRTSIPPVTTESNAIPSQSLNGTQQMIQDMRRMFEERRQLQEKQIPAPK